MAVFRDREHAAQIIGGFFRLEGSEDDHVFAGSGTVLAYSLRDPEVRIVLDARAKPQPGGRGYDVYVDDPSAPSPTIEFWFDADTFDKLYRGEVSPMALMTGGKAKAKGDIGSAMRLLPAMARSIPHYKKYRESNG